SNQVEKKKKKKGLWEINWRLLFRSRNNNDFEKKLQHLSKEEVIVHTRLKRRTQNWRKLARALIIYSIVGEALLLGVAILSTRSTDLPWQVRAVRVLPVFALPAVVTLIYSGCASYNRMRERKDHQRLEKLKAERQEKINELKEKTNYYNTQQLIQRYDPDPEAKAAAASILASKLGAESGLKLALAAGLTNKEELTGTSSGSGTVLGSGSNSWDSGGGKSMGMRNRRPQGRQDSVSKVPLSAIQTVEGPPQNKLQGTQEMWENEQAMESAPPRSKPTYGGWIARLAAMLVGEDPTQCYALICRKCHMHNGLARKEDFQYITYYCPHCYTLNGARQVGDDGIETDRGLDGLSPIPLQLTGMSPVEGGSTHRVVNSAGQSPAASISASGVPLSSPEDPIVEAIGSETEAEESVGDLKAGNIRQTESLQLS
ncbi:unnamed protein product, partial [Sphagnum jensenii]